MSIEIMSVCWKTECGSHTEKLVLIALADNANDQGVCWPSINYLARKCDLSRQGVLDQISKLASRGLVKIRKNSGRPNVYELVPNRSTVLTGQRRGRVNQVDQSIALTTPVNAVDGQRSTSLTGPVNGVDPNRKEPSIEPSINRHASPELNLVEPKDKSRNEAKEILDYLKKQTGREFRDCESSLDPIKARLAENGVNLDGCKKMIDRQVKRWGRTDMAEYLRPTTLFSKSKFEGYYAAKDLPVMPDVRGRGNLGIAASNEEDNHKERYGWLRGSLPLSQRPLENEDENGRKISKEDYERRFPITNYDCDR